MKISNKLAIELPKREIDPVIEAYLRNSVIKDSQIEVTSVVFSGDIVRIEVKGTEQ